MIQRALPEGALDPGGFVKGFVYFPPLHRGRYGVTFTMALVDAKTNENFGTIDVPFRVE
jgi:hypothetical protein